MVNNNQIVAPLAGEVVLISTGRIHIFAGDDAAVLIIGKLFRPLVAVGSMVEAGQVIADYPDSDQYGEGGKTWQ